jgi:hypothetical protein
MKEVAHIISVDRGQLEAYSVFVACCFHISKSLTPQRVLLLLNSHRFPFTVRRKSHAFENRY